MKGHKGLMIAAVLLLLSFEITNQQFIRNQKNLTDQARTLETHYTQLKMHIKNAKTITPTLKTPHITPLRFQHPTTWGLAIKNTSIAKVPLSTIMDHAPYPLHKLLFDAKNNKLTMIFKPRRHPK